MPSTATETPALVDRRKRLLAAIPGEIEPVGVSRKHAAAIYLVAAGIGFLILLFTMLALAAIVGPFLVAWRYPGLSDNFRMVLIVIAVLSGILTLFLIKPLFAPLPATETPKRLRREVEPLIYDYVDRLCEVVGAPKPRSISIDCDVNATAGLRRGLASLSTGDMRLTIGLPLIRGLSLRQLTGVLAHELGHFSQGSAMRVNLIIRRFMQGLARMVYERDGWDEALVQASNEGGIVAPVAYLFRLLVWISRIGLSLLLYPAEMISCVLMRQMEFDADRFEVRVSGVTTFLQTSRQIVELSLAHEFAFSHLSQFLEDGRLADDFPALVVAQVRHVPEKIRKEYRAKVAAEETGWFHTHPSTKERIASARAEGSPGIFVSPAGKKELAATVLFMDYERLTRSLTVELYKNALERDIQPEELFPVEDLLKRQVAEEDAYRAAQRFFRGMLSSLRPLPLPERAPPAPEDVKEAARRLKSARDQMVAQAEGYERLFKRFDKADDDVMNATARMSLAQAGFSRDGTRSGAREMLAEEREISREAREEMDEAGRKMEPFEKLGIVRLYAGLQLLQVEPVRQKIEDGDFWLEAVPKLLDAARFTNSLIDELQELRRLRVGLLALYPFLQSIEDDNVNYFRTITGRMEDLRQRVQKLRKQLRGVPYPLDHAKEKMTLAEYAITKFPEQDDLYGLLTMTDEMFRRLGLAHLRICGRLTAAAERVETALGLPELPDPPEREEDEDEDDDDD